MIAIRDPLPLGSRGMQVAKDAQLPAPRVTAESAAASMQTRSSNDGSRYWIDGFPELMQQWDFERNDVPPSDVSAGSARRVWWRCPAGPDHLWRAKPNNRTRGAGCPFCTGRRVSVTNSLATLFPAVAVEWHPTRNGVLTPADVVAGATRVVYWQCPRDARHVWRSNVRERTRSLSSCPFCANVRACESNSLLSSYPAIALEWHPSRNGQLTPAMVTAGSHKRVFWECAACRHTWCVSVINRTSRASSCPACARLGRAAAMRCPDSRPPSLFSTTAAPERTHR
jgi:hypothetical protein